MQRNKIIDRLRGLAMLSMILIHSLSFYLNSKINFLLWDYLHWAVALFIFSSFYILYIKIKNNNYKLNWLKFIKKRLIRLLVPYYYFIFVYFIMLAFFEKEKFTLHYLLENLLLYKGIDFNWLVLLFLFFSIFTPIICFLSNKKIFSYGILLVSISSSLLFIFKKPFNYNRLTTWIPWLSYIYLAKFFFKNRLKKKILFLTGIISFSIFLLLRFIEIKINHNTSQFANKYPPTLYHLSYGAFWTSILYFLSSSNFFNYFNLIDKLLNFFSLNSYSLYFIHILVMLNVNWLNLIPQNWIIFFLEISTISFIVQILLNRIKPMNLSLKKVKN